MANSAIDDRGR